MFNIIFKVFVYRIMTIAKRRERENERVGFISIIYKKCIHMLLNKPLKTNTSVFSIFQKKKTKINLFK